MARTESELGEEVPLSAGKNATQFVIGSLAGVGGGLLGLWFAWHVITTPNNGDLPRWLTVLLGWLCLLFSVIVVLGGMFTLATTTRLVWRGGGLFIGPTHLRYVARDGQILTQVPYDNIEEIRFVEDEGHHHGPPDDRVAIRLIDPGRDDTILRKESPLAPDEETGEIIIEDRYRVPPRKLYNKLVKKWRNRD